MEIEKIKNARKAVGLTQEELAKKIGVSVRAISRYECGYEAKNKKIRQKLATALELKSVSELYTANESMRRLPLLNLSVSKIQFKKSLKSPQKYMCIDPLFFSDASFIIQIDIDIFHFKKGDLIVFSEKAVPQKGDVVLTYINRKTELKKWQPNIEVLGVAVSIIHQIERMKNDIRNI